MSPRDLDKLWGKLPIIYLQAVGQILCTIIIQVHVNVIILVL